MGAQIVLGEAGFSNTWALAHKHFIEQNEHPELASQ